MTVVAEKLVDNTELFINTVNGKSNEASQLVQDINAFTKCDFWTRSIYSKCTPRYTRHRQGDFYNFGDEDTLELSGRW